MLRQINMPFYNKPNIIGNLLRISQCTHITTVVDEPRHVSVFRCVNDRVVVDTEQIAAAQSHGLVSPLPLVSDGLSDHLTDVLNHHLVRCDRLQGKQAPVVDATSTEV